MKAVQQTFQIVKLKARYTFAYSGSSSCLTLQDGFYFMLAHFLEGRSLESSIKVMRLYLYIHVSSMMKSCYLDAFCWTVVFAASSDETGSFFLFFGITLGKDACLYWGLGTTVKIRFLSTSIITSKLYQNIWASAHLHILPWMTRIFLSPWNIAAGKYKHSKHFFFVMHAST